MGSGPIWLFPAASFILLPTAFFVSYVISVIRDDVQEVWPYVSDTGAIPPESCVFGQLINMSAGLMIVSIYLRHRQVMAFFRATRHKRRKIVWSSRIFLGVGIFASFGLMLVANFQEGTIKIVHFVGAGIAFMLGLAYGWHQTILSFVCPPKLTPRWLAMIRLIVCTFGTIFFIGVFARNMVGENGKLDPQYLASKYNGTKIPAHFYRGPGDRGYTAFLVTTICEWSLAICFSIFLLTLAFDFYGAQVRQMRLELKYHEHAFPLDFVDEAFEIHESPDPKIEAAEEAQSDDVHLTKRIRMNGIPLPGLCDANFKNHISQTHDHASSDGEHVEHEEQKPRGLRRTYDIAIYDSYLSDHAKSDSARL